MSLKIVFHQTGGTYSHIILNLVTFKYFNPFASVNQEVKNKDIIINKQLQKEQIYFQKVKNVTENIGE